MDPVLKTDAWALAQAYCGINVTVRMRELPASVEAYKRRLHNAADYMGLAKVHVTYDAEADRYVIGSAGIRLTGPKEERTPGEFWFKQFPADDTTTIVEGRDLLDIAAELVDLTATDLLDDVHGSEIYRDPLEHDDIESFGL